MLYPSPVQAVELPLILDPIQPEPKDHAGRWVACGWTKKQDTISRVTADDVRGALIQHVLCRYYVGGVSRDQLAAEYGYSVRQIQSYLSGRSGWAYSRPILAALHDIGIPAHKNTHQRLTSIVRAQQRLIADYDDFLNHRFGQDRAERYQRLQLACRLLAFVAVP
jgi:hypothetical protein